MTTTTPPINPTFPISAGDHDNPRPEGPFPVGTTWDFKFAGTIHEKLSGLDLNLWVPSGFNSTRSLEDNHWGIELVNSDIPMMIVSWRQSNNLIHYGMIVFFKSLNSGVINGDYLTPYFASEYFKYIETQSANPSFKMYIWNDPYFVNPGTGEIYSFDKIANYELIYTLQEEINEGTIDPRAMFFNGYRTNENEGSAVFAPVRFPQTFKLQVSRDDAAGIEPVNAVVPVTLGTLVGSPPDVSYSYTNTQTLKPLFHTIGATPIIYDYEIETSDPLIKAIPTDNGILTIEPATPTTTWTGTRDIILAATASNNAGTGNTARITFRVTNTRPAVAPTITARNAVVPVTLGTLVGSPPDVSYSYTNTQALKPLFQQTSGTTASDYNYTITNTNTELIRATKNDNGILTIEPATPTTTWTGTRDIILAATASNNAGTGNTARITFRVTNTRPAVAPTITARNAVENVTLGTLASSFATPSYIKTRILESLFEQTAGTTPVRYSYELATNPSFIDAEERNGILTIRPATTTTAWTGAQYVIVTAEAMNSAGSGTATIIFRVTNTRPAVAPTITARNAVENVTLQASNNYTETYDLPELFDTTGTDPKTYNYEIANTNTGLIIATKSNGELTIEPATTTIRWSGIRTLTVTATARNEAGTSSPASITFNVTNNRPAPNPPPGYWYCIPWRRIWEPPSCGWIQLHLEGSIVLV